MSYQRWLASRLLYTLSQRRVVLLSGPRQSGKTTLVKSLDATANYLTLDDITLLASAKQDPISFVKRQANLLIIDEVQRVPDLLLAIKQTVDQDASNGQYLLTGSAKITHQPNVQESLAGRVGKLHLRTLSQGEIESKQPQFLENAFQQKFLKSNAVFDKDIIIALALRGGFPEPLSSTPKQRSLWHRDYIEALIDHDMREIINIRRRESLYTLLEIFSAWSSKLIDYENIGSNLSLTRQTLEAYSNALEALFLIERLPAWTKTDYARIGRKPKVFLSDSGLMASILKWQQTRIRMDDDKVGKLTETFVYTELAANIECADEYQLYHYRDREKREIDFIIEREDGAILAIEVKAGMTIKQDAFKHLKWFSENLLNNRAFIGVVLYSGNEILSFGDNLWAVPIGSLWA